MKNRPLILILLLAFTLRILLLFFRGTLWFDELFSIHFSSVESWSLTWKYWTLETNPPLYTLILRFWLKLGDPANPFYTRSLALIFGLSSIAALFKLGKVMFNERVGALAAFFLAISGIHLVVSTETRSYTLFGLLAILAALIFYRIFFLKQKTRANWIGYAIVTILLFYVHLTAVLIPLTQLLTLVVWKCERHDFINWWKVHVLAGALWLAWAVPWFISKFNTQTAGGWFFDSELFGHANIFSLISTAFFVNNYGGAFIVTLVMLAVLAGIIKLTGILSQPGAEERDKQISIFLALWGGFPIITASLLGVFVPKYVFFGYPALYILAGHAIDKLFKTNIAFKRVLILILLVVGPSTYLIATTTVFSWYPFVNYIHTEETKNSITLLALPETLAFKHFYKGQRPAVGIYLSEDNLPYEEKIVRFNWNKQPTTDEELTEWIFKQIDKYDASRIFMIQNSISYSWIQEILYEHGWRENFRFRAPGYTDSFLIDMYDSNKIDRSASS